jgi:hypothetical protein
VKSDKSKQSCVREKSLCPGLFGKKENEGKLKEKV